MQTHYDFTAMRVGLKAGPYKRKIIVCPKCGLRGTDDGMTSKLKDGRQFQSITHTGHFTGVAGMVFFHTDSWCSVVTKAEA